MHYSRWRRHGSPHITVNNPRGTGWITKRGYKKICIDSRQYLEHRLVMENKLGRKLLTSEEIHHKNGVRTDNRPENLEVWSKSHPSGQRPEDLLKWAYEIIALYEKKLA